MSFLPPINGGKAGGEDKEESATAGPTETVENCPHMHAVNEHESSPLLLSEEKLEHHQVLQQGSSHKKRKAEKGGSVMKERKFVD